MTAPTPTVPAAEILRALGHDQIDDAWQALHALPDRLGVPWKAVESKIHTMADKGLVDWGTSAAYPWLTDKGRERAAETAK